MDYEPMTDSGVISGEDGQRWLFRGAEWAEYRDPYATGSLVSTVAPRSIAVYPVKGLWVDFMPEPGTGHALAVYALGAFVPIHVAKESAR